MRWQPDQAASARKRRWKRRRNRWALARDWNRQVNNGRRPTIRGFARDHGLSPATWHREYRRGEVGASVPDRRDGRRREYNEYDPYKAQDAVDEGNGNKGAAMRVTNKLAALFAMQTHR